MVGPGDRYRPSRSRRRFPEKFGWGSQRMDGDWPCLGLDQYKNYSRFRFLPYRNSDWHLQAMVGKGSYGPAVETRPRQLPCRPQAATGFPSDEAVLASEQYAVSSSQKC
jgi:hypothetical protein